jgi:mono/diheme cytochrome c family protein
MRRRMKEILSLAAAMIFLFAFSAVAEDASQGKELVQSNGCANCHKIEGKGGSIGPALDGIGSRMSDEQIHQMIVNPPAGSGMPSFKRLSQEKIDAIVDYLKSLK